MKTIYTAIPIHREWCHESQDAFHKQIVYSREKKRGYRFDGMMKMYDESLIPRARHNLLECFLTSKKDFLLFFDSDIVFLKPTDIEMLVKADKPIIGGVTVCKKPPYKPNFIVDRGNHCDLRWKTKPIKVRYVATSCMLIRKDVALAVAEKFKYPFECFEDENGTYLSEDYAFCHRAKRLGFQSWIHPLVHSAHLGVYTFTIDDYYNYNKIGQNVGRVHKN